MLSGLGAEHPSPPVWDGIPEDCQHWSSYWFCCKKHVFCCLQAKMNLDVGARPPTHNLTFTQPLECWWGGWLRQNWAVVVEVCEVLAALLEPESPSHPEAGAVCRALTHTDLASCPPVSQAACGCHVD